MLTSILALSNDNSRQDTHTYWVLIEEGLVASIKQVQFRIEELWEVLHSILPPICLAHELTPVRNKRKRKYARI